MPAAAAIWVAVMVALAIWVAVIAPVAMEPVPYW